MNHNNKNKINKKQKKKDKENNNEKRKYNKKIIKNISLTENEINEIIKENNYIPIKRNLNNINTKFIYLYKSKNFIYYACNKRKFCNGKGKVDLENKEFLITTECTNAKVHDKLEYDEFCELYNKNINNEINYKEKYIQKYIITYILSNNISLDNPLLLKKFNEITNEKLLLTKTEISRIRNKIIGTNKNISIEDALNKIKESVPNLIIKIEDINYKIKKNNKIEEKEERIYYFGKDNNMKLLSEEFSKEIFMDITFKVIPKIYRPYKLLIIAAITKTSNVPKQLIFILLKSLNEETYSRIFGYLNLNYNFKPSIIHSDFEKAIHAAIKKSEFLNNTIHSRCFFHFSQMIRNKLKKIYNKNKRLNKISVEIIRNLEIYKYNLI